MDIILHSYTFRDYPLEEALRAARRFGYAGLELHQVHFNPSYAEEEIGRCVRLAMTHGAPIACVDFKADLIHPDPSTAREAADTLKAGLRACAKHGVPRMNGFTGFLVGPKPGDFTKNGSAIATESHYARCAEGLEGVCAVAEECGVALNLEIHMNTIHDSVASTQRLMDLVGSAALFANPDPGNMFATRAEDRNPAALDALARRIGYFHFKNCRLRQEAFDFSVPLSDGDIDFFGVLQRFPALGYTGPVCIEYVGNGDPHVPAEADIHYLKNCLAWIAEGATAPA
jgi:sugar phosphate isomerase/epimerase